MQVMASLIAATSTETRLKVHSEIDPNTYPPPGSMCPAATLPLSICTWISSMVPGTMRFAPGTDNLIS